MHKNSLRVVAFAAPGFISLVSLVLAQESGYTFGVRDATAKALGDDYYFYTAQLYASHASDHADVLDQYASVNQPVPAAVIKEHTAAIRGNLTASSKSYSKLSKEFTKDPEAMKHLTAVREHYTDLEIGLSRLEGGAKGPGEPRLIGAYAKTIKSSLASASTEHKQFMETRNKSTPPDKQ